MDWLVEVVGASAPAAAAGFAAFSLAPIFDWPPGIALAGGATATFALAFAAMRLVPTEEMRLPLAPFEPVLLDEALLLDDACDDGELLLDVPAMLDELRLDQPIVETAAQAVAELLLDDPLPAPAPDSRVVQLFADGRMPTAGQLKQRIDHHRAGTERAAPVTGDASDALSEALAELRRSLRQA